jgi:hypothetical protein
VAPVIDQSTPSVCKNPHDLGRRAAGRISPREWDESHPPLRFGDAARSEMPLVDENGDDERDGACVSGDPTRSPRASAPLGANDVEVSVASPERQAISYSNLLFE